jgi:hypothetical protein
VLLLDVHSATFKSEEYLEPAPEGSCSAIGLGATCYCAERPVVHSYRPVVRFGIPTRPGKNCFLAHTASQEFLPSRDSALGSSADVAEPVLIGFAANRYVAPMLMGER